MAEANMGGSVDADVAAGAQASAKAEIQKAGGDPSKIDYKAIAQATAAAGGAAVCGYFSAGAAAPLCGWAASKAVGWFTDKGIPAIGDAIGDVGDWLGFGKDRPKPVLIGTPGSDEWYKTNLVYEQPRDETEVLAAAVEKLQALHQALDLPGPYSTKDVVKRLKDVHKVPMELRSAKPPRGNVDYSDAGDCVYRVNAGDWTTHPNENRLICRNKPYGKDAGLWNYYWAPNFRTKFNAAGGANLKTAQKLIMNPDTKPGLRLPLAKKVAELVEKFDHSDVKPWEQKLAQAMAAEAAYLSSVAVANKVMEQATLGPTTSSRAPRREPPKLHGNTLYNVYTAQLDEQQLARWTACMRAKAAAAGGRTYRVSFRQCRDQVIGAPKISMLDMTSLQTVSWLKVGAFAAAAGTAAYLLKRRR